MGILHASRSLIVSPKVARRARSTNSHILWPRGGSLRIFALSSAVVAFTNASAQDLGNLRNVDPFHLSGSIGASSNSYNSSGIEARESNVNWLLTVNATATVYGISAPFSATFSSRDKSFSQPFNQFGISPTYKWVTMHFGYRSMTFSRYTLSGATFLGAGIEMKPGKFRFASMYGRFQRAVEADSLADIPPNPAYKRAGFGFKVGYGSQQSFVDLSIFKASDDTSSLKSDESRAAILPVENACAGLTARAAVARGVSVDFDMGASAFTRDSRAPELTSVNKGAVKSFNFLFTPKSSSRANFALSFGANYSRRNFRLRLQYRRIEPDYETLGSYYFASDVQNITVSPSFDLLQRKLRISLSLGYQTNNLDNSKFTTTVRKIGSANINWFPTGHFSLTTSYSNFDIGQKSGTRPLIDSVKVGNTSQNFTISPRLSWKSGEIAHGAGLTFILMDVADNRVNGTNSYRNYSTDLSYSVDFTNVDLSAGANLNFTTLDGDNFDSRATRGSLNFTKRLFARKLSCGSNISYSSDDSGGRKAGVLNMGISGNIRIGSSDTFSLNLDYLNSRADSPGSGSFNEFRTNARYSRRFSF